MVYDPKVSHFILKSVLVILDYNSISFRNIQTQMIWVAPSNDSIWLKILVMASTCLRWLIEHMHLVWNLIWKKCSIKDSKLITLDKSSILKVSIPSQGASYHQNGCSNRQTRTRELSQQSDICQNSYISCKRKHIWCKVFLKNVQFVCTCDM